MENLNFTKNCLFKVFMCVLLTLNVIICQKDSDESRPYEFGFTIDGQQHRHEKKDQNGIIQGEFGFITADGVYHVTVYATDENGNFKILSMRNIRISAPLDGSPALGPISPEASKYLKKPNQIEPAQSKPVPPPMQQQFQKLQKAPAEATTQKPTYAFSTHSTIKPACAGCGLITPAPPGQKFKFQNPIFNNPPASPVISANQKTGTPKSPVLNAPPVMGSPVPQLRNNLVDLPADTELLPPGYPGQVLSESNAKRPQSYERVLSIEGPQQNIQNNNDFKKDQMQETSNGGLQSPLNTGQGGTIFEMSNTRFPSAGNPPTASGTQPPSTSFQEPGGIPSYDTQIGRANFPSSGIIPANPKVQPSSIETFGDVNNSENIDKNSKGSIETVTPGIKISNIEMIPTQGNTGNLNQDKFGRLIAPPFGTSGPNPLIQPQELSKLPPVSVSGNVIHVMGKKPLDIPIKDKYPGMSEGLPDGVEPKDVTNILYKFKYTVGFHGHYERGLKNGAKIGGYFVNGRDGISRVVTYVADENGYRPKFKFINLGLDSPDTPNEKTEKTFGLKDFEFVWYPIE